MQTEWKFDIGQQLVVTDENLIELMALVLRQANKKSLPTFVVQAQGRTAEGESYTLATPHDEADPRKGVFLWDLSKRYVEEVMGMEPVFTVVDIGANGNGADWKDHPAWAAGADLAKEVPAAKPLNQQNTAIRHGMPKKPGAKIREMRKHLKMTQDELAEFMGSSRSFISHAETNRVDRKNPMLGHLYLTLHKLYNANELPRTAPKQENGSAT